MNQSEPKEDCKDPKWTKVTPQWKQVNSSGPTSINDPCILNIRNVCQHNILMKKVLFLIDIGNNREYLVQIETLAQEDLKTEKLL